MMEIWFIMYMCLLAAGAVIVLLAFGYIIYDMLTED